MQLDYFERFPNHINVSVRYVAQNPSYKLPNVPNGVYGTVGDAIVIVHGENVHGIIACYNEITERLDFFAIYENGYYSLYTEYNKETGLLDYIKRYDNQPKVQLYHSKLEPKELQISNKMKIEWLSSEGHAKLNKMKEEFSELMSVSDKEIHENYKLGELADRIHYIENNYLPDSVLSILLDELESKKIYKSDIISILGSLDRVDEIFEGKVDLTFEETWLLSKNLNVNLVKYWFLEKVNLCTINHGDIPL